MFGRKHNTDTIPADQRIKEIHYENSVRDLATFKLAGAGPDARKIQEVVDRGREAGIDPARLARDADAMRSWGRSAR